MALLLFLQFLRISASLIVLESKDCAYDRIGCSIYAGQELLFINGIYIVDKTLFCSALPFNLIWKVLREEAFGGRNWERILRQRGKRKVKGKKEELFTLPSSPL